MTKIKNNCILVIFLLMMLYVSTGFAQEVKISSNTVITAENLSFDYKRHIAVFENDVVVVDPQVRMKSDKLLVLFNETNSVKAVTALENVFIFTADKTATCDKAIYIAKDGEVILIGNAKLNRGKDSVVGDRITFWINEDRMECIPGRLIIFQDEQEVENRTKKEGAAGRK